MAPKKKKKKPEHGQRGHNSNDADLAAEILKVAKAQRSLDNERRKANADFRERHKKLTDRLRDIDISRQAFAQPYANYCRIADSENDDDAKVAQADNKIHLAAQRRCYDALSVGMSLDWIDLIQEADEIKKLREQEELKAAEEAAESADDATDTPAEV